MREKHTVNLIRRNTAHSLFDIFEYFFFASFCKWSHTIDTTKFPHFTPQSAQAHVAEYEIIQFKYSASIFWIHVHFLNSLDYFTAIFS